MVANIRGYTPNYSFKLINFDTPRWHTLEYSNWNMVDAMFLQSGTPQLRGVWQNNTLYLEGDRVFDEETSAVYRCLIEHESAELGTFAEDRTLHPTYWSLQLSGTPVYRGEWLPGVTYVLGDIVYIDQYEYFLCTQGNVSSGTFPADAAKWQTIFDATQVVTDAEAAKAAAYQFSLDAQGSANDAAGSATDAQTAEDNAETWADEARAATGGFRWAFSSSTTAADPAIGRVAFNTADPTTVTEMYVSAQSAEIGNPDVSDWLVTWDDSTNTATRGTIQVRKVGSPEQFLLFQLTGSIIDNGTWLKFSVSYSLHSGTVTNGEQLSLGFVRAGDTGPTGTGGGDMLRASNLNDVVSKPESRNNLGLGTAQIPTFSQVLLGNEASADMHAATKGYVDSSPSLYVSDTAPSGVLAGSLWWDSDKGTLYVRYNDGTSTQWVQAVATPGLDTSQLATKEYTDARVLDAMAYSGMQINGSMEISQERGSTNIAMPSAAYIIDNWFIDNNGPQAGNTGQTTANHPYGYTTALNVTLTTGNAAPTGVQYLLAKQTIEGIRISRLSWGKATAQPITLSFWVSVPRPGTYSGAIRSVPVARMYAFTFTYAGTGAWEYKTVTIPGDVAGTWPTSYLAGMDVTFSLLSGPTLRTPAGVWTAGNFTAATGAANMSVNAGDQVFITGVTVLPGIQAPTAAQSPLLMRPYGEEWVTCQRYYQHISIQGILQAVDTVSADTTGTFSTMRVAPTMTQVGALLITNTITSVFTQSALSMVGIGNTTYNSFNMRFGNYSGLTAGASYLVRNSATPNQNVIKLDARL